MNQGIYEQLQQVARERGIIHYGPVAQMADLDMSQQADRTEIGRILGEISEHEHEAGRPLISAVVILKDANKPGPGFFTLARNLGLIQPDEDDDAFWNAELQRVWDEWS